MMILQAVTLCLALCIFSLQAKYSYGESTTSKITLQSMTLNDKWEEYGCKNNPKLDKPFGKLQLCLGTVINQLIFRILQNYSPTPLPEHLIIPSTGKEFEPQIRKYIETYLPEVFNDKKKVEHVFDQVNEYIFTPLVKYLDQFPMDVLEPQEQAVIKSRREDIANILKKYLKEPLNPVVPVTASSFQENLPAIIRYLTRYAPDITANLDVLTLLLYRIKKDSFKEIAARDLSKLPKKEYDQIVSKVSNVINQHKKPADRYDISLPYFIHDFQSFKPWLFRHFETFTPDLFANKPMLKNVLDQIEEIFEGIEPNNATSDNINSLDKSVLLKFVEKYYPEQFGDQVFIDELVQNYEAQPKSNVVSTSEPDNKQIKNALLYFFKKVYPKLSVDEQFVEKFTENFKPNRRNQVDSTVEAPESETISPTREEIVEYVKEQLRKSADSTESYIISNGKVEKINMNGPATSPDPEEEFISEPSRRIQTENLPADPSVASLINEDSESEPIIRSSDTAEFSQAPTSSEAEIIRQKILECIKETYPHLYANKPVLTEILKQIENEILSEKEEPPMSLENQIRRFRKKHVPKIVVDQSDIEEKDIEIDIIPEIKESSKTIEKIYIIKGNADGAATVSLSSSKPDANGINPEEKVIEIDITPETNQSEKVYYIDDNDSTAKVSLSHIKPNHNAAVHVQVTGNNIGKSNNKINLRNSMNFKTNNAFGKISKETAEQYRKEYMKIIKSFQENTLRNKQNYRQPKIEMPKPKNMKSIEIIQPATAEYNERLKKYMANKKYDKSGTIAFKYKHNFFPLMMRTYGPLLEKDLKGETLTKEEGLKMNILETMFAKNQAFQQLYLKKIGPQDKLGVKAMLYNMYKVYLKENNGKSTQIDPMKNIKYRQFDNPNIEYFADENEENRTETQ